MSTHFEKDYALLTEVIDKFQCLFEITDVVFSHLRILDPTEEEMDSTEKAINEMKRIWKDMEIYFTPKAHILFEHMIDQIQFFEGIADVVGDFIECLHQIDKKH